MSKDNVCKWKEIKGIDYNQLEQPFGTRTWKSGCCDESWTNYPDVDVFKYCPFCGKPIRVIEEE